LRNICVTNDHGYVPFVVCIARSFPHSWLITWFVTRVTRRVPLVEQELRTLPEHMSSLSLVFCVVFCQPLIVFCPFSFGSHCIVSPTSTYGLWLSLLYLQTLLMEEYGYNLPQKDNICWYSIDMSSACGWPIFL
jgi:hypothetical protein